MFPAIEERVTYFKTYNDTLYINKKFNIPLCFQSWKRAGIRRIEKLVILFLLIERVFKNKP